MKEATFNNLIRLEYPDDFKELSEEENERYFSGDLMRLSFLNKDKHILLSVSKSKNLFLNRIVSLASIISGSLSCSESSLKEYEFIEEYDTTIFDKPAITACFAYTANDGGVRQYGELSVFKVKSIIYSIYCISRFEDKEDSKKLFKQFKDSFISIDY